MKIILIIISALLLQSCKLGQSLHQEDSVDKIKVVYHLLFNNRRPSHKPDVIYSVAYNFENKTREFIYNYYITTGVLKKYKITKNRVSEIYVLNEKKLNNDINVIYFKLTSLDSAVINRMKYYLDTLHYNPSLFLENGNSFKKN
jgi:hypothetical protein